LGNNPVAKAVLAYLAERSDDDGVCWPANSTILDDLGLADRRLKRIFQVFREIGLLKQSKRPAEQKRGVRRKYAGYIFQLEEQLLGTDLSELFTTTLHEVHGLPATKTCPTGRKNESHGTQKCVPRDAKMSPTGRKNESHGTGKILHIGRTSIEPKGNKNIARAREAELPPSRLPPRPSQVGVWDGTRTPDRFPDDPRAQEISDRTKRGEEVSLHEVTYLQNVIREVQHGKARVQ